MTDEELNGIEQRCLAAMEGPWMVYLNLDYKVDLKMHIEPAVCVDPKFYPKEVAERPGEFVTDDNGYVRYDPNWSCDLSSYRMDTLTFVAHSRDDVMKLLAEIRRLKSQISN